ncbi:MAG: S8 family serine peptidase [Chitinophagaceae bacterium]
MRWIVGGTALCVAFVFSHCKKTETDTQDVAVEECAPVTFSSIPGEAYIVVLEEGDPLLKTDAVAALSKRSGTVLERCAIEQERLGALFTGLQPGFLAKLTPVQADALRKDAEVQLVERDRIISLATGCFSLVAPSTAQWGVRRVGVGDGTGKRIWVIDTGIDLDHPDLLVSQTLSASFVSGESSADDGNGHGTHVAGIIGALNNTTGVLGVASGATLVALKALDDEGEGNTGNLIRALNYIAQNGSAGDVINMSLGSDTISNALDNAVLTLANRGFLFAVAAGNDDVAANKSSPARVNHANVYTVSAVDSLGRFASFSNFGNDVVDFAAPGVNIVSTYSNGRYARLSGTSMAAPHVAGILALRGSVGSSGTATNDPDGTPDPIAKY